MPIKTDGNKSEQGSLHSSFWNALTKNSDSLALSQLWLCGINKARLLTLGNKIANQLNLYEVKTWNMGNISQLEELNSVVLNPSKWDGIYPGKATDVYMLARGISFIGDGLNISRVGSSQVGAMKGMISDGRNELTTTNITFLESNISFVDGFLRPWSALVGHRSLKDESLRCDIEFFALEKWTLYEPLRIRKSMVLKNAVPVSIDAEEYNYTGDKLIERQIQFAFDRYEMNNYPAVTEKGIDANFKVPYTNVDAVPIKADERIIYEDHSNIQQSTPQISFEEKKYTGKEPNARSFINEKNPIGYEITILEDLDMSLSDNPLNTIGNMLGAAQTTIQGIKGKTNDITTSVAQGLKAFGADTAAENLMRSNQKFNRNLTAPVADIIGTGQGYITGVDNVLHTVGNITGASRVDANDIKEHLR